MAVFQLPHATALVRRVKDAARGGPQALVVVGGHELHAAQAAVGEAA